MIIGFDVQALQTTSRNRGIGRYCENLVNKILEFDPTDKFVFFLNDLYEEEVNLKPSKNSQLIRINYLDPRNAPERTANNIVQFAKYRSSKLDIFGILSTFEGHPINSAVINPYFDRLNSIVFTIIYDFIPIRFSDFYLSNPVIREVIYRQLKIVYHSDILFAISESTRQDAINLLGINPDKVVTIWGSASDAFYYIESMPQKSIQDIKKKYNINKKFVLYVGGIEFRKNVEKSILAFSKIERSHLDDTSYVIVCQITDGDRKRLYDLAKGYGIEKNLILTGYIPDEDLNLLYNCCDLFIFPSLMEGLGIPVLEAMQCGAPIIGSNNSSTAELIEDNRFMFDPENDEEIASLINRMLIDVNLKNESIAHSLIRSKDFSWDNSAKKVLAKLTSIGSSSILKKSIISIKKPRIALFTPLPPKRSGISYYAASLLPLLSKYWDIDIFIDDTYVCDQHFLIHNFNIYSYREFDAINRATPYDSIVYQFGNSDNHIYMFDMIKKYPGVVVMHDIFLSGILWWMTARVGKVDEFMEEARYSHGEHGVNLVNRARNNLISWEKVMMELQISKRVLDCATEIIVHSNWDRDNILRLYPEMSGRISLVNQFAPIRINSNKANDKKSLGFEKEDFLICSFGFVASTKKNDSIIKGMAHFLSERKNAKYILVGDYADRYGETLKRDVEEMGLSDKVIFTGFVPDDIYKKYLDVCDICISLRTNTRAGTSASVNHALGAGLVTIISDEGPFSEFPDGIAIKITPKQEGDLSQILEDLYKDEDRRKRLSENARKFAETNLSKDVCAERYVEAVNKVLKK